MRTLTVQQPHAGLIADRLKWVENRSWYTSYRGPLAIHAGKGTRYLSRRELEEYPTGVIIAKCNLIGCLSLENATRLEHQGSIPIHAREMRWGLKELWEFLEHEYTEGPYCLILADIKKLEVPVPAVGRQKFWNWQTK